MTIKRIKKPNHLLLNEKFKVGCIFQVEKFKEDGTITYKGPKFPNLVLDCGLDGMDSYPIRYGLVTWCNVGTGSTAPDPLQTGLVSMLASSNTLYTAETVTLNTIAPACVSLKRIFVFGIGSCTGNLTEVGLSRLQNGAYFNRQLFKDINGDPTTITVLSDEGIRITAEVFLYSDMQTGDTQNGSFLLNGTDTINYVRKVNIDMATYGFAGEENFLTAPLGFVYRLQAQIDTYTDGFPTWSNSASSIEKATYVPGSFESIATFKWLAGNYIGTINSIYLGVSDNLAARGRYSGFFLTPGISKADTVEVTITAKRTFGRLP